MNKYNIFENARIKLTLWYVLIIAVVSLFFSSLTYYSIVREVNRGFRMQRLRMLMQEENLQRPLPMPKHLVDQNLVNEVKKRALINLGLLNAGVLVLSFGSSYYLAGYTLKPIRQAMERQKNFIANASHELKTPITAIKLENEITLRNSQTTKKEYTALAKSNLEEIEKLEKLIGKIINQNKVSNISKANFEILSNKLLVNKALEKVNKNAKSKNIKVVKKVSESNFKGDKDLLTETLAILLDNAVKYSPKNSKVKIESYPKNKSVIFKVSDNGIGIKNKDKEKVFDRFYKVDKSRKNSSKTGFGLGLSIAKEVVDMHKGTITISSSNNYRTVFEVNLPT